MCKHIASVFILVLPVEEFRNYCWGIMGASWGDYALIDVSSDVTSPLGLLNHVNCSGICIHLGYIMPGQVFFSTAPHKNSG